MSEKVEKIKRMIYSQKRKINNEFIMKILSQGFLDRLKFCCRILFKKV